MNSLSTLMLQIGVFSIFLFSIRLLNAPLLYLPHLLMLILIFLAIWKRRLTINRSIAILVVAVLAHGICGILFGNTSLFLVTENFLRLSIFYLAFSSMLKGSANNVRYAVRLYLKIGTWVSALGLFALVSYVLGFRLGYDYSWFLNAWDHIPYGGHLGLPRAQSIFGEPSHAVYVLAPAIYFAIGRLLGQHQYFLTFPAACIIFLFIFMTNSTTAYTTIPIALLLNLKLSVRQVFIGIGFVIGGAALGAFLALDGLNFAASFGKIELLYQIFMDDGQTTGVSGSSYSAYVGNRIAFQLLQQTYGFGGGLGAFEFSFERIMGALNVADGNLANTQTGGSLMARSIAELGFFGIGLWVAALAMGLYGALTFPNPYRAIHLAMLVGFIPFFLRFGTYDSFGFAFFLTIFLVNAQNAKYKYRAMNSISN